MGKSFLAILLLALCTVAVTGCSHNGKKIDWWQFTVDVLLEDDDDCCCCCDHDHD